MTVAPRLGFGVVLAVSVGLTAVIAGRAPAGADTDLVARGRHLYLESCVSCHGVDGRGVAASKGGGARGPSLRQAGEAAAYYYLSTGRMPLNDPGEMPHRKAPAFGSADIGALVAYVGSLGPGPGLPRVSVAGADVADGGVVFRANCQACHSATGSGGALSYGRAAPSLRQAEPEQVAAALRSGPGQMPVFGPDQISARQLDDVAAYVHYLRRPDDRGGLAIGRLGPVPEGFVAWSVGVVALLACVFWIGTRSPARRRRRDSAGADATTTTEDPPEAETGS